MDIICVNDYEEMSEKAASIVVEHIKQLSKPTLGLATGSTPEGLYKSLIQKYQQNQISFKDVTTFNLDEYTGLSKDDPNSYHYYMSHRFFDHIDINPSHIHIPNGKASDFGQECIKYDEYIRKNKIDIQILGIGENGHIGFNEPGTPFASRTHVVELAESTIQANSRYFKNIEEVPTKAITMGIETIMESNMILLLVSGEKKAEAMERLLNDNVSEDFPASILQRHGNVKVIADKKALAKVKDLTRVLC